MSLVKIQKKESKVDKTNVDKTKIEDISNLIKSDTTNPITKDTVDVKADGKNIKELVGKGREAIQKEGGFKSTLKEIGIGLLKGLGFVLQGLIKVLGVALNIGGTLLANGMGGRIPGGIGACLNGGRGLLGGLLGALCNRLGNNLTNSNGTNLGLFDNILGSITGRNNQSNEYNNNYTIPTYNGIPLYNNYNYENVCNDMFKGTTDASLFNLLASKVSDLARIVGWNTKVNKDLTLPMAEVMMGKNNVSNILGNNQEMGYNYNI